MAFDFIWPGTILPYYGAMFVLAAGAVHAAHTLAGRDRRRAALGGWLIRWWRYERTLDGTTPSWLTDPGPRSPRGC